ncbi:MAG TPA: hypothetical protein VL178_01155 [Pseudomonas sp.]|jgi:hypothetical protein|nr:hypothetical protein [Pseudomonas sp.]
MEYTPHNVRCKQCGQLMVPRTHHGHSDCPFCLSSQWDQERSAFELKFFALTLIFCGCLLAAARPVIFPLALMLMALGLWILRKADTLKDHSPREALRLLFKR